MERLTLQFEDASVMERLIKIIELMNGVSIVKQNSSRKKKSGLDIALDEIKEGKIYHAKSADDLFKQVLG